MCVSDRSLTHPATQQHPSTHCNCRPPHERYTVDSDQLLVSIDTLTSTVHPLITGAGFYAAASFSLDCTQPAWQERMGGHRYSCCIYRTASASTAAVVLQWLKPAIASVSRRGLWHTFPG
jgi:hypothetical protein